MSEEFCLSDKLVKAKGKGLVILKKDVKEFIKKIDELPMEIMEAHQIKEAIKELSGKELV